MGFPRALLGKDFACFLRRRRNGRGDRGGRNDRDRRGAAAASAAAAAADDWFGELWAVPLMKQLVVGRFVSDGVTLRYKNKAAGEKRRRAKNGWSERLAGAILAHLQKSEDGRLLLERKYAGAGASAALSKRLNEQVNNWQKGNSATPAYLKAAATAAGIHC